MTDQPGAGGAQTTQGSQGSGAPGAAPSGSAPGVGDTGSTRQPNNQGWSPALERRQQSEASAANRIAIDGAEYSTDDVRAALVERAEAQVRKTTLPQSPNDYKIENTPTFKAPEGVQFQWDMNDPLLQQARQLAHKQGLGQDQFSSFLDIYAANKIGEMQRLGTARAAELSKLGSAAQNRIEAISTWLKSRAGSDAEVLVNQMARFPHAGMIRAFEKIIQQFSGQGGAQFDQRGRTVEETNPGRIANYENMSFKERRVAQMEQAMRGGGQGRGR